MSLYEVTKVCLTGGPCAGKTTVMRHLREEATARGYAVAVVPEAATILLGNGFRARAAESAREEAVYQWLIAKTQLALEDALTGSLTLDHRPGVLLCDRGVYDNLAYMSPRARKIYEKLMGQHMRHSRYDLVAHLDTAPAGFYLNNEVRIETHEQALDLDRRTWEAWEGHPRRFRVDNSTDFAGKIARVEQLLLTHLPPVQPVAAAPEHPIHYEEY